MNSVAQLSADEVKTILYLHKYHGLDYVFSNTPKWLCLTIEEGILKVTLEDKKVVYTTDLNQGMGSCMLSPVLSVSGSGKPGAVNENTIVKDIMGLVKQFQDDVQKMLGINLNPK